MKCEIFRNNTKIAGPIEYDRQRVKDIITQQGGNPELVPAFLSKMITIATIQIKPVREVKPNLTRGQKYGAYTRRESTDEVIYEYEVKNKLAEEMREEYIQRLSAIHNHYEKSPLNYNGVLIRADLEARINANTVLDLFKDGVLTATEWRGRIPQEGVSSDDYGMEYNRLPVGKIPVSGVEDMEAIYLGIVSYLKKGFEARSAVEDKIKNSVTADLVNFDVLGEFDAIARA